MIRRESKNRLKKPFRISSLIIISIILQLNIGCESKKETTYKFKDPKLSINERVTDLIGHMTLSEKVSQMRYDAPAIERLGVPAYNWWNECLHGVARAGEATVFPQAIGMGATWNAPLLFEVGTVISDEARAKTSSFYQRG